MRTRVYIETTIPSFYHTLRTDAESVARKHWTRKWWKDNQDNVHLTTSVAVLEELGRASNTQKADRIRLLSNLELLPITTRVDELAAIYIDKLVMPQDPTGDALHLALASIYNVGVLLTWNCKHLANPNKMEHIRSVNLKMGLSLPLITTPLNLIGDNPNA